MTLFGEVLGSNRNNDDGTRKLMRCSRQLDC